MKQFNRLIEKTYAEIYNPVLNEGKIFNWLKNVFKSKDQIAFDSLSDDHKATFVFCDMLCQLDDKWEILSNIEYTGFDIDITTGAARNPEFSIDGLALDSIATLTKKPYTNLRYLGFAYEFKCYAVSDNDKFKNPTYIILSEFGGQPIAAFTSKNKALKTFKKGSEWEYLSNTFDRDLHMPDIIEPKLNKRKITIK